MAFTWVVCTLVYKEALGILFFRNHHDKQNPQEQEEENCCKSIYHPKPQNILEGEDK